MFATIARMPSDRTSSSRSVLFAVTCAIVIACFAGMAAVGETELTGQAAALEHYNLLVEGFQHGHLSVNRAAPAGLLQLADPYDPVANARYRLGFGLHDMSYYKGRMYLYFGVTPALVLLWPWAALTGHYLLHRYAVAVFCAAGFLASAGIVRALGRRYFSDMNAAVMAACVLALGLASGVPILQQRAEFWEVAISCGYALAMLALGAVWLAVHDRARRAWWLAGASLLVGLAAGARPFLVLGAPILLVPLAQAWRETAPVERGRLWRLLAAVAVPLLLCGAGLMLYNDLRFENPFEFGQRYQLAGDRQDTATHFSLRYLWFDFCVYFLEPVRWSRQLPFAGDIATPRLPPGHAAIEDPFGILTNIPIVWLALAAPLAWRGRGAEARARLRGFVAAVAALFGVCALVLCLFYGTCSRYEMEFLPALVVLAVIGILGAERALAGRLRWGRTFRAAWIALLVFSVTFNLLAGLDRFAIERNRRGNVLAGEHRFAEAAARYQIALRFKPAYVEAHSNLGNAWRQLGRIPEAIAECRAALRLDPTYVKAHNNLGNALLDEGRMPEAIAEYQQALRLSPDDAGAHYNYGVALFRAGRIPEAIAHYEAALRSAPEDADAHYNLGNALLVTGRAREAIAHFEATLELKPEDVVAHNNLGNALLNVGRLPEAIAQFQSAVRLKPDYAEGHNNLGAALYQAGRTAEAITQFEAALRLKPDYPDARANLERLRKLLPAANTAP
ncbi:MAG TPA: tetratricopeptide repeat protein [Opitutaceae bacterium]|nr:tetratricopeptide repeat protein [Opitutaceae bacterium]